MSLPKNILNMFPYWVFGNVYVYMLSCFFTRDPFPNATARISMGTAFLQNHAAGQPVLIATLPFLKQFLEFLLALAGWALLGFKELLPDRFRAIDRSERSMVAHILRSRCSAVFLILSFRSGTLGGYRLGLLLSCCCHSGHGALGNNNWWCSCALLGCCRYHGHCVAGNDNWWCNTCFGCCRYRWF